MLYSVLWYIPLLLIPFQVHSSTPYPHNFVPFYFSLLSQGWLLSHSYMYVLPMFFFFYFKIIEPFEGWKFYQLNNLLFEELAIIFMDFPLKISSVVGFTSISITSFLC